MARVSLVLPVPGETPPPPAAIASWRAALEGAGHEVDVIVAGPGVSEDGPGWRALSAPRAGLASAAYEALALAGGEVLLVLDGRMGYDPADLVRVVGPLERGEADVVVASRSFPGIDGASRSLLGRGIGALARPLVGTTDPTTGLIGLTAEAARALDRGFDPVGAKFSFDLLTRASGRRADVGVRVAGPALRGRPGLDDLRQLKRLADHRFGNFSRLLQFCAVGASGMVVDLSLYAFFQWLFRAASLFQRPTPLVGGSLALTVAAALSVGLALTWNFSLNRRLTFSYARNGSPVRQFITYVLSNFLAISVSLVLRLALPRYIPFFDAHKLAAALVGIVLATGISFSMSRWFVFSRPAGPQKNEIAPALAGHDGLT
jgi:dolichol-phosphate mannosyltransferase